MDKNKEIHLRCSCGAHQLHLEKDHEDEMWYGSFWVRGYQTDTDWRFRLRCIWHILKTGRPYGDEIILERKDLEELKKYVDSQLKS